MRVNMVARGSMPHQCLYRSSFSWCASACSASPAVRPIAAIVTPLPVRPWGAGRCKWTATDEPAVTETPKSGTTAVRSKATPQDVVAETSTPDANALLEQLAASVGVWCKLSLADGRHGRGMFARDAALGPEPPRAPTSMDGALYLSIPASVALSPDLPGSCSEVSHEPSLQSLLHSNLPWEVKLGGIVAVACSPSTERRPGSVFAFWQEYRRLMPTADQQASLLFFSAEELEALQDAELLTAGQRWQQQVCDAYEEHFACGEPEPVISMSELLWGVGTVESRAFSVKLDGREHAAAVPFLDMVNHQPHALCFHTYQPATAQFELRSLGPPLELGAESIITYGSKANNARLVEQYGFIIPGNPFDRVPFPDPSTLGGLRISRDKLVAALGLDQDFGQRSPDMQRMHELTASVAAEAAAIPTTSYTPREGWRSHWGEEEERRINAVTASMLEKVCWRNLSDLRQVRDSGATEPEHLSVGRLKLWAEAALAGYKTDIATDKAELGAMAKQGEGGSREGARGRLAVEYRLEKKLLLASAIRTLAILQAAYSRFNSSCE